MVSTSKRPIVREEIDFGVNGVFLLKLPFITLLCVISTFKGP